MSPYVYLSSQLVSLAPSHFGQPRFKHVQTRSAQIPVALYTGFFCTPSSSRNSRRNCRATSHERKHHKFDGDFPHEFPLKHGHSPGYVNHAIGPTSTAPCQRCSFSCSPTIFRKATKISASRTLRYGCFQK